MNALPLAHPPGSPLLCSVLDSAPEQSFGEHLGELVTDQCVLGGHDLTVAEVASAGKSIAHHGQEVADVRLVADLSIRMTEPRHRGDATWTVEGEARHEPIPLISVQRGEVTNEDTHHLVVTRGPRLPSVLVVVVRARDLAGCTDDPLMKRGCGLQWGPVPRLVDADRLLQWEFLVVLAVLDAVPDLDHLVVPVMAPDVSDTDDVVLLDVHAAGVVHLEHLDTVELDELPLVGVLAEVFLATFAVNDAHATSVQRLRLQIEPAFLMVPADDLHVELGPEHGVLIATEAEADRRPLDHLEIGHLTADFAGVSV